MSEVELDGKVVLSWVALSRHPLTFGGGIYGIMYGLSDVNKILPRDVPNHSRGNPNQEGVCSRPS